MSAIKYVIGPGLAAVLLCAGCASTSDYEMRRQATEEDIAAILSVQLDPAEYGETKRCLRDSEYRTFRALDDRRLLFIGRGEKRWINTLRSRCPDLRFGDVLVVESFSLTQMCDMDKFLVTDWFRWPWYRRWPWNWGTRWGVGPACVLGKFQPVTEAQVEEIRAAIRSQ